MGNFDLADQREPHAEMLGKKMSSIDEDALFASLDEMGL